MINQSDLNLTGKGSPESDLTIADFSSIISEALSNIAAGSLVSAIISHYAQTCRRVNLGFMDYKTFSLADYEND